MNLSHTLARNETKQQTSILAKRNFTTAKLNILHHTTNKGGIERNKVTRKQKGRKLKMKPDNLRKRMVVNNSKNGESKTFSKALLEGINHKLTRATTQD